MRPGVALTRALAFWIDASIVLAIELLAVATAIAIAAPSGAMDAATATDAVFAVIFDVSRADSRMLPAVIPVAAVPSPSIVALTLAAIWFVVVAPAPAAAKPYRPPAIATEPATTRASIVWFDSAWSVSLPPAVTLERSIDAWTSAVWAVPSAR